MKQTEYKIWRRIIEANPKEYIDIYIYIYIYIYIKYSSYFFKKTGKKI